MGGVAIEAATIQHCGATVVKTSAGVIRRVGLPTAIARHESSRLEETAATPAAYGAPTPNAGSFGALAGLISAEVAIDERDLAAAGADSPALCDASRPAKLHYTRWGRAAVPSGGRVPRENTVRESHLTWGAENPTAFARTADAWQNDIRRQSAIAADGAIGGEAAVESGDGGALDAYSAAMPGTAALAGTASSACRPTVAQR